MKSNKKLLLLFLGLLLLFALSQLFNSKKDRSFKSELLRVDTVSVNKIIIHSASDHQQETVLSRSGSKIWTASQNGKTVPAIPGSVDGILKELPLMKVKSIATQSKDRWNEYEISDSIASHIEVFAGDKKLADFYSGKFGFNPQAQSMLSYIRLKDDPTVYVVDGFQSMTFNAAFNSFRDKTILSFGPNEIEKVGISIQGSKSELVKSAQGWLLNGQAIKDSTALQNYINSIISLNGSDIVEAANTPTVPIHSASLVAVNKNVNLDLYSSGDSLKPFLVHSSANADVYFKEDSAGVYNTVIGGLLSLMKPAPASKKK